MKRATLLLAATMLGGCVSVTAHEYRAPPPPVASDRPPLGIQYLFGSAEAAALSQQSYGVLVRYVAAVVRSRPVDSVVLTAGASPAAPTFVPCGNKPLAAVFDADETLIWNVGSMRWFAEHDVAFDPKVWDQWERTGAGKAVAMPGAVEMVAALRAAGVTVIANTNRQAATADGTVATLRAAGLGAFRHGETLFLAGDDATGSSKDARRATIAARYCVVAMAGDQLGDFSQAFNDKALPPATRKAMATSGPIARLWGQGWFLLPNPLYGPWDKLNADAIYPPGTAWAPEETK